MRGTAGDAAAELGAMIGGFFVSLLSALLAIAAPALFVGADLYLGPQFMGTFIAAAGFHSTFMTVVLPWALSISTTGFQYMLFRSFKTGVRFKAASGEQKLGLLVGLFVTLLDTATDVGGMTAIITHDPVQGMNIVPDHPVGPWIMLALIVAICCALQEFILLPALGWAKGVRSGLPGGVMVEWAVWLVGQLFGVLRGIGLGAAMVGIFILDFGLSFFYIKTWAESSGTLFSGAASNGLAAGVGIALTGFQMLAWRKIRQEGFKFSFSRKIDGPTVWFLIALGLALLDSFLDMSGFTTLLYGIKAAPFPPHPGNGYLLMLATILSMCLLYETLAQSALSGVRFKGRKAAGPSFDGGGFGESFDGGDLPPMPSGSSLDDM